MPTQASIAEAVNGGAAHFRAHPQTGPAHGGVVGGVDDVPAGPLEASVHVRVRAAGADPERLRDVVAWARTHSPVVDAVGRAVPTSFDGEIGWGGPAAGGGGSRSGPSGPGLPPRGVVASLASPAGRSGRRCGTGSRRLRRGDGSSCPHRPRATSRSWPGPSRAPGRWGGAGGRGG